MSRGGRWTHTLYLGLERFEGRVDVLSSLLWNSVYFEVCKCVI